MRPFSVFAILAATPAAAHEAGVPHAHADWALPVGLCLIALAGIAARQPATAWRSMSVPRGPPSSKMFSPSVSTTEKCTCIPLPASSA